MNVKSVEKENGKAKVVVEIDKPEFEQALNKAYAKCRKDIMLPGFRKGKAPRKMVESMYGATVFYEDAVNEIFPEIYTTAIVDQQLKAVGSPSVSNMDTPDEGGVVLTIETELYPEVTLGQYKGIEVPKREVKVEESEVDAEVNRMAERNARIETVDRAAQMGDTVVIDFEGFEGGKPFQGGKAEDYSLTLGSGSFIPGFEEALVGAVAGEERDVNVTFPENYAKELAGKPAVFKCKVHEVKESIKPELDDEFAKDVSDTCETLDDLKKEITERLKAERQEAADNAFEEKVLDAVIDGMKADIPAAMIDAQVDTIVQDFGYRLQMQGMGLEQYLKMTGTEMGAFRAMFQSQAERQVKTRLALQKVVELEGITVSDKELEEEYAKMAEQYKMEVEKVKAIVSKEALEGDLKISNALEFIKKNAKVKKAAKKKAAEETAE